MPIVITATADTAAEIPEALRSSAKEQDGKFVLSAVPEGWGLDNVAASRGKLTKLETDAKRAGERLKGYAIDDKGTIPEPEQFKEMLAERARLLEAQGKLPNADELRRQAVADAERTYTSKLTAAEKRAIDAEKQRDELDRLLDNTTLDAAISQLVAEMRPKEGKAEIARLMLREKLRIDKANGKRVPRVLAPEGEGYMTGSDADGYMPVRDYALNGIRTKHADLFQGDDAQGAGARSTTGAGGQRIFKLSRSEMAKNPVQVTAQVQQALQNKMTIVDVD